jgi:hypothetical protein
MLQLTEAFRLENGKNAYGAGSWASSLRYHNGVFHASTFAATSGTHPRRPPAAVWTLTTSGSGKGRKTAADTARPRFPPPAITAPN